MERYAEESYGERIADVYDLWYGESMEGAAAVSTLSQLAGPGPILELGIGTGRLALPLAARGFAVHGVDASPAMVSKLRAKPAGDRIPVTIGNFATQRVDGGFSLIFVAFNTLFALLTQEEQIRCFENVALHQGDDALRMNPTFELINITTGRGIYAGVIGLAENDTFSLNHVLPGRYRIRTQPVLEFDVGENDVTGLTIHLGKPDTAVPLNSYALQTVQGTVEGLGDAIPAFEIAFIPARTSAAAHVVAVSSKEFSMNVPEGEYRIGASGLPDGYAVTSISAGPLDLTSAFLLTSKGIADRFMGSPIPGRITIRLTRQ